MDFLFAHDLQSNAQKVGSHILRRLTDETKEFGCVAQVRGKGLMIGIELCEVNSNVADHVITNLILEETRSKGLLIGKGGIDANVLRIAPPLSLTSCEADEGVDILLSSIKDACAVVG